MKTLYAILAGAALLLLVWQLTAGSDTTESFRKEARFALLEAEVNVSDVLSSGGISANVQKTLFKLDTRTGQVWVLQLAVNGTGDPTVRSAVWAKVSDSGTFYRNGPPSFN